MKNITKQQKSLDPSEKKSQSGFTIIEVLIVLAIAGLILLIVFLAVPALQRNSRNTQRRNDVQSILGAVQEYSNNHNGSLPGAVSDITNNFKPGFYDAANIEQDTDGNANNPNDVNNVIIVYKGKCDSGTPGNATATGASARGVALLYTVETAGSPEKLCQEF